MDEIVIVDGYNIIGAWPELRRLKENNLMIEARDRLLNWLVEYKVYSGKQIIVVFDAHQVSGNGKIYLNNQLKIYFTKEEETADELIEKMVIKLKNRKNKIYVATSDYTEQRIIFAQGALRISARELELEKETIINSINQSVKKNNKNIKSNVFNNIDGETKKILEKWRRSK